MADFKPPVKILDAGGTETFWEMMGLTDPAIVNVAIVNTEAMTTGLPAFKFIQADARNLSMFRDKEFDIVFSNSVIEHVGSFADQKKMADEIMRIGKKFFVQTPNYWFPFEPHFMFPLFQFLPQAVKIKLLMSFRMGWFKKCSDKKEALHLLSSIRLLKKSDLIKLFPGAIIYKEKFLGFTKSFAAY